MKRPYYGSGLTERLEVRISKRLKTRIEALARARGWTTSRYTVAALEASLEAEKGEL